MKSFFKKIFKVLISLKFAIMVMMVMTMGMIAATLLESIYDTQTSQYFVYRHVWFLGILILFGVNILCVALSRLPWEKRHIPFLLAHLGILVLLYGSWLTFQFGLDGNLTVSEGTEEAVVEVSDPELLIADLSNVHSYKVGWRPPFISFKPIHVPEFDLKVSKWITHAEQDIQFLEDSSVEIKTESQPKNAAVHLKLFGGPKSPPFMRRGQDLWLWSGDPNWTARQLGPAFLHITANEKDFQQKEMKGPKLKLFFDRIKNNLNWSTISSSGEVKNGVIKNWNEISDEVPLTIDPQWKNDVRIQFFKVIANAKLKSSYKESNIEFGSGAPESAIFVESLSPSSEPISEGVWLGLGEKAQFTKNGKTFQIGYFPKRLVLPFSIRLNEFKIDHYEGTQNPMAFSSHVSVLENKDVLSSPRNKFDSHWISMNEPLKQGGYTFYQASYVPGEPRPTTSIFSVNKDPGRWVKYLGAILLVLGAILFFIQKVKKNKVIDHEKI